MNLQRQALNGEWARKTLAQRFQAWIVDNSSAPELLYWSSTYSMHGWISSVARCASTSVPIDFLSARLYAYRLPHMPAEFNSLGAFFDQAAEEDGLIWSIKERGLWMAQEPPLGISYVDSHGTLQEETSGPEGLLNEGSRVSIEEASAEPIPGGVFSKFTTKGRTPGLSVAEDFRTVVFEGKTFTLTRAQSLMFKVLYEAL